METVPEAALTVDVEDWFHVCGTEANWVSDPQSRVLRNIDRLVTLFAEADIRATFFVLGSVAEALPSLLPLLREAGHEIASHGYSHRLVTALDRDLFRDELRRTTDIFVRHGCSTPRGFRAPQWSMSPVKTPWAFEILREEGYRFDSSVTPLAVVGDPGAPWKPYRIGTCNGSLWEIPPMVLRSPLVNLPVGGGWGFRFFPFRLIQQTMKRYNSSNATPVIFLHPREIDPQGPRIALSAIRSFAAYGPRTSAEPRLRQLFPWYRWKTLGEMVDVWNRA